MYDGGTNEFSLKPKRIPTPVVGKFVKGSSWKADYILYDDMDDDFKLRVDNYLKENNRELWGGGKKDKLLLSLPECQPRVKIIPKETLKAIYLFNMWETN